MLDKITPLSSDERIAAAAKARDQLRSAYSAAPTRESFYAVPVGDYPQWISTVTGVLLLVIFAAATVLSMFRIYNAGVKAFNHAITGQEAQAAIAGISSILLAESLMIASVLAASIYFKGRQRWLMVIPGSLGALIALSGNLQVQPKDLFGWLDAITPPIAVMFISLIAERVILSRARVRQEQERQYQAAAALFKTAEHDPENHPKWSQFKAQAYRDAIVAKNARRADFKAIRDQLTQHHWKVLVNREIKLEDWYTSDQEQDTPLLDGSETAFQAGSRPGSSRPALAAPVHIPTAPHANGHTEKE